MLPPLPLGEVEPQARERVKRMSVSRRKLRQRTPRAAATASDLPRCAGEVKERNKPRSTKVSTGVRGPSRVRQPTLNVGHDPYRALPLLLVLAGLVKKPDFGWDTMFASTEVCCARSPLPRSGGGRTR